MKIGNNLPSRIPIEILPTLSELKKLALNQRKNWAYRNCVFLYREGNQKKYFDLESNSIPELYDIKTDHWAFYFKK